MADYYPLIARAVAGLEKNTGDARRVLYERARTALVAQLRSVNPPLSENDVTRERLALEESIRKVEAEAARRGSVEPAAGAPTRVRAPEFPRWDPPVPAAAASADVADDVDPRTTARSLRSAPAGAPQPNNIVGGQERYVDPVFDQPLPSEQAPAPRAAVARQRTAATNRSVLDAGLKDFQKVASDPEERDEAPVRGRARRESLMPTAREPAVPAARETAAPTARDAFATPRDAFATPRDPMIPPRDPVTPAPRDAMALEPPASHDFDRLDDRPLDHHAQALPEYPAPPMLEQPQEYDDPRPVPAKARQPSARARDASSRRPLRDVMKIAVNLAILAVLGALIGWQWPNITALYRAMRTPAVETATTEPTAAAKPRKFTERLDQSGGPTPSAPTEPSPQLAAVPPGPAAAVAQKVVLYEEDPDEPQGRRYVGSAIWRTERVSPGPNQPAEIAIRADVEIPDRKLAMTWSLRRNTDSSLPASHTVEIMFRLPQDFSSGGVSNVPGILMKASEQTRGVPLAGLAVKVTNGFFLIGLSAADGDRERNVAMLKDRQWFDIPVVYNNNRRAILAVEKGTPGERVFQEAFAAWRQ